MRYTSILLSRASRSAIKPKIRSLALSVYFKQPDLGMKDYEILSRASAFLLSVDPRDEEVDESNPYAHLEKNERDRKSKLHAQDSRYTPVTTGTDRDLKDLNWLEFAPREVRPTVHCVCSSHVLAPFLWRDYYPQDWLKKVRQEHCVYSLEVFDPAKPLEALGKFALNPYPIHHPEGRDVALIHLKQEDGNLKLMKDLGVEVLHMRDLDGIYEKGDEVSFDGYVVEEADAADGAEYDQKAKSADSKSKDDDESEGDTRVFHPYQESGKLAFHTKDRFFALTPEPLPGGLCGGPVLDKDGDVCGVVEGIVAKNNSNKDIAGSAAFMPNYMMAPFIDFAERFMLQKVLPESLFQKAVMAKTTNSLGGGVFKKSAEGGYVPGDSSTWEEAFDRAMDQLQENYSKEEVDAIVATIREERKEALDILSKEGGDLTEIMHKVRQRTMDIRNLIHEEYRQGVDPKNVGEQVASKLRQATAAERSAESGAAGKTEAQPGKQS